MNNMPPKVGEIRQKAQHVSGESGLQPGRARSNPRGAGWCMATVLLRLTVLLRQCLTFLYTRKLLMSVASKGEG